MRLAVGILNQFLARIVNRDDVGVVEHSDRVRFTAEAREEGLILSKVRAHDLDSNLAAQTGIRSQVHFCHATVTDGSTDGIATLCELGRDLLIHL